MKKLNKVIALILSVCSIFTATACGENDTPGDQVDLSTYQWATEENYNGTNVLDSSEIPSYTGTHEIDLVAWNHSATGNFKTTNASEDLVTPEIKRITGVSINKSESFDNKGSTADVRYNNLLTMGQYPDIAYGSGWIEPEDLWDLTDLIKTYCPTIMKRMPSYVWKNREVNGGQNGKVFAVPFRLRSVGLNYVDPLASPDQCIMFSHINENTPYVLVREDVLKDAYPDALTTADISRIYQEKGGFTKEELYDVGMTITSAQAFREVFLPKIEETLEKGGDKYMITESRRMTTMLVTGGSDADTWDFLGKLVPSLLGMGPNSMNSNFSYWDVETQKVECTLQQDFYKNEVYEWAKMIDDGTIVSKTGMTTNHSTLQSELNSGFYAIGYLSNSMPSGNYCTWKGQKINYRKVYLNIPINEDKFMYSGFGEAVVDSVKFFKDQIREDELPQLLRWLDFQCSRTADMLYAWGPDGENAIFTTNTDGKREYKDADLVQQMVFSTALLGDKVQKYNLLNGTADNASVVFPFYYQGGSIYHPKATYDLTEMTGLAESYYTSAIVNTEMNEKFVGIKRNPSIHVWTNQDLDGVESVWAKRKNIEDDLKQVLLAGATQKTFNDAWQKLQNTLNNSGWTKSYFNGKVTNAFLKINSDYLDKFYKGE